jgi:hypothetical protein
MLLPFKDTAAVIAGRPMAFAAVQGYQRGRQEIPRFGRVREHNTVPAGARICIARVPVLSTRLVS